MEEDPYFRPRPASTAVENELHRVLASRVVASLGQLELIVSEAFYKQLAEESPHIFIIRSPRRALAETPIHIRKGHVRLSGRGTMDLYVDETADALPCVTKAVGTFARHMGLRRKVEVSIVKDVLDGRLNVSQEELGALPVEAISAEELRELIRRSDERKR